MARSLDAPPALKTTNQGRQVIRPRTVQWRSAGKSHVGAVRTLNEDAFLDRPEQSIWAVADGMGGHDAGDKASMGVVTALAMVSEASSLGDLIIDTKARLSAVNESLCEISARKSVTVGSTVVVLLSQGTHVAVVWAGDSRAYLHRNGRLTQLTVDHSRVQELVGRGLIDAAEADDHPDGNIITRAIGVSPEAEVETKIIRAEPGDAYMLCSDGLYREVGENEIIRCLQLESCDEACERLIRKAIDGGGNDNISAIVIRPGPVDSTRKDPRLTQGAETQKDLTVIGVTGL